MSNVIKLKPKQSSSIETRIVTPADFDSWKTPSFQRPVVVTKKVMELVQLLKANGGFMPGTFVLGQLPNSSMLWKVDCQHRIKAGIMSGLPEFMVDIKIEQFENTGEMAKEFERVNGKLRALKPDDILRAAEENNPLLWQLRQNCPFVAYNDIRRASHGSCMIGMSSALRCWFGSAAEKPRVEASALTLAGKLDAEDMSHLSIFFTCAFEAWGTHPSNYVLWANLNQLICMWIFRRMVFPQEQSTDKRRHNIITIKQFSKCLMSVSAKDGYTDWLQGRNNAIEKSRSACYDKLKRIFIDRIVNDGGKRPKFPTAAWCVRDE